MAGGLGMLLGLGVGAAAGALKGEAQKKQQHDAQLFDFYSKNPQLVADSPDAQKFITKYGGKDTAAAFIGMAQHTKAAAEQFGQNVMGGGGSAPTAGGGAPVAGGQPQPPQMPDDVATLRDHADRGERYLASPDAQYLSKEKIELGTKHIAELRARADRLETQNRIDARQAKYDSPEAKAAAAGAEATARNAVNTSPEAIAGAAKKSGAEASAAATAREKVEYSEPVINKKIDAAVREQKAKAEAAGQKPVTPAEQEKARNALVTRAKNLSALYTQEHGSSPWLSGKDEYKSDRAKWFFQHDPEVAVTLGLAPSTGATGQPDGNYDLNGKHLYAYKGQVYDLGVVAK